MKKPVLVLVSLLVVSFLLIGACKSTTPTASPTSTTQETLTPTPAATSIPIPTPTTTKMTVTEALEERPLPSSIDAAKQRHTIKVEAGASSDDIIATYGQPSHDYWPENFNPPVRYIMEYRDQGLKFGFTRDKLSDIDVTPNFQGEIFSLRIGDKISRAIAIYGKDYTTFDSGTIEVGICTAYYYEAHLPNWFIYVQDDIIVAFHLHDKSFYGSWMPSSE